MLTLLPLCIAVCGTMVFAGADINALRQAAGLRMFLVSSFLFLIRDLGLMLFFNLAKNQKRADMILLLNLLLLYGVLPGILTALDLDTLTALFWPRWDTAAFPSLLASAAEAALALFLVYRRWQAGYAVAGKPVEA
jgi:hypothetical protein